MIKQITSIRGARSLAWLLLTVCAILLPARQATAQEPEQAKTPIEAFRESAAINAPSAAVLITDLRSGKRIAEHNAGKPLVPASIMKCITTATLLEKVGEDYRYDTPVYVTGEVRRGVLEGNILVKASGDPSVNSRHINGNSDIVREIIDALRGLGVDSVAGSVIFDESDFPGPAINPTWASGDLPHAYGTGTHGFNFEDNASGKSSVKDPGKVFATRLTSALARAGIRVSGTESDHHKRHLLCHHYSVTVDEIMRSCMMRSDNQFAEGMLRTVGAKSGRNGSSAAGAESVMKYWHGKKADTGDVKIVDGSGLSRSNRMTAEFMTDVLTKMAKNPYYASFFPLAGQEGTLKKFLAGTPLDSYIALKTGSMNGIQCYAGYKLDDNYEPTHVVVVMMNNMKNRATARAAVERLLLDTFFPTKK